MRSQERAAAYSCAKGHRPYVSGCTSDQVGPALPCHGLAAPTGPHLEAAARLGALLRHRGAHACRVPRKRMRWTTGEARLARTQRGSAAPHR